jgi:hypothetical protein
LKRAIQGAFSTNCIVATGWNCVQSGMHTRKPAIEPTSASHRAGAGLASSPMARTATPKAMGTQMESERRYEGIVVVVSVAAKACRRYSRRT